MTRTVADSAVLLQAIAGYDPEDLASREFPAEDYESALPRPVSGLRVGLASFALADLHPDAESAISQAVNTIRNLGCRIHEVDIPVDSDRSVQAAEAYSVYLPMLDECSRKCHAQTVRRLQSGAEFTAADYIQKKRDLDRLRRQAKHIFSEVDLLVTPTVPLPAFTIAELESNLAQLRARELLLLRNTRPFNVLGIPAVSVPCGFTQAGLPVGLQIAGPLGADALVLSLAHAYEQATEWHKRIPSLEPGEKAPYFSNP